MITNELVSFETARLAKEKGFDVPTFGYYRIDTKDWYRTDVYDDWNDSAIRYSAPTQSLLQRWLREEKNIVVEVGWFDVPKQYVWVLFDTRIHDTFKPKMTKC